MARWYKGDTHNHTVNSDGKMKRYELIERAKKCGLDYVIITDHNFATLPSSYDSDGLNVIMGQEITGENGHVNIWGSPVGMEPPYDLSCLACYNKICDSARENGAVISVNHPYCSLCGFHAGLDDFDVDCVEVWNTIQHSDNVKNLGWWHNQLMSGKRLAAVGGADYHSDMLGVDFFAMPTTVTYAESNTPADILKALKEGRSVITNKPSTSMIYLTVEGAMPGDTAAFHKTLRGECTFTKVFPGMTLRVWNNDCLVFEKKTLSYYKEYVATFPVNEKGFVRAEIDYKLRGGAKKVFAWGESNYLHAKTVVPELFWAFTNAVYIE